MDLLAGFQVVLVEVEDFLFLQEQVTHHQSVRLKEILEVIQYRLLVFLVEVVVEDLLQQVQCLHQDQLDQEEQVQQVQ